jgi:hypothetical protein
MDKEMNTAQCSWRFSHSSPSQAKLLPDRGDRGNAKCYSRVICPTRNHSAKLQGMVLALAILLVCTTMLLIYAILCSAERRLERHGCATLRDRVPKKNCDDRL